jgi:phospho-N-acetylmuramoyl-pentapeptide-transferase
VIVGFALIGFLDDYLVPRFVPGKRGLDWLPKLGLQILVAGGAALIGQVSLWDGLLLVFLLLFFSNAFNFADGMDGLAASLWIALTFGIWLMAFWLDIPGLMTVSVAVLGGIVPFLVLNSYPARVFMGDVGSLPLGAVLGGCVWMMLAETTNTTFAGTPFLIIAVVLFSGVMILELIPPPLQILSVKLFKRRIFPMTPIHHAFEKAGIPETRIVWGFFLLQLVLSMAAYGVLLLAF